MCSSVSPHCLTRHRMHFNVHQHQVLGALQLDFDSDTKTSVIALNNLTFDSESREEFLGFLEGVSDTNEKALVGAKVFASYNLAFGLSLSSLLGSHGFLVTIGDLGWVRLTLLRRLTLLLRGGALLLGERRGSEVHLRSVDFPHFTALFVAPLDRVLFTFE